MDKRPCITAAVLSVCGLLTLLVSAAPSFGSEVSPGPALRIAGEPVTTGSGTWADTNSRASQSDNPPAFVLNSGNARGILGSAVRSAADEDMGRIVDVIVDHSGAARAAVIDFGGFLGVGSRKIAVDWDAVRFTGPNYIVLDMTRDQVKAAPQYEPGKPIIVLGAAPDLAHSQLTARMLEQ